jgi:hypothetical protein
MQKIATIAAQAPVATCEEPLQMGQPSEAALDPKELNELFGLTATDNVEPVEPVDGETPPEAATAVADPEQLNELFDLAASSCEALLKG